MNWLVIIYTLSLIIFQMVSRTLIYGARQIVTVTRNNQEKFLCGKDMKAIGILKSDTTGLSLMIEK